MLVTLFMLDVCLIVGCDDTPILADILVLLVCLITCGWDWYEDVFFVIFEAEAYLICDCG